MRVTVRLSGASTFVQRHFAIPFRQSLFRPLIKQRVQIRPTQISIEFSLYCELRTGRARHQPEFQKDQAPSLSVSLES